MASGGLGLVILARFTLYLEEWVSWSFLLFVLVDHSYVLLQELPGVGSEHAFLTFKLHQLLVNQFDMTLKKPNYRQLTVLLLLCVCPL